jgi:hypothetical protein
MSASSRRDLALTLRRHGLVCAGVDLWIPTKHFSDPSTLERAIDAVGESCQLAAMIGAVAVCIELDLAGDPPSSQTAEALLRVSNESGVRLAVCAPPPTSLPSGMVRCVDPARWLAAGADPVVSVADPAAVPRLSDLVGGARAAPASGGGLDVTAYRIGCEVAAEDRPVVADLRGLGNARQALQAMESAWAAGALE